MSVCFAIRLGLTSQLSGLLSIPLVNLHKSYQWKTRLKKKESAKGGSDVSYGATVRVKGQCR